MKNLFFIANEYIQQSDWKDLALIKFCLFSMGVIIGLFVPSRSKKVVLMTACCVFVITYPAADEQIFPCYVRKAIQQRLLIMIYKKRLNLRVESFFRL